MFTAALFVMARTQKQPRYPSTEKWIKIMWYIYTMEYYSVNQVKNKDTRKFESKWMVLEKTILCEVTQNNKDKHCTHKQILGVK